MPPQYYEGERNLVGAAHNNGVVDIQWELNNH